jgi:hypothetical protein
MYRLQAGDHLDFVQACSSCGWPKPDVRDRTDELAARFGEHVRGYDDEVKRLICDTCARGYDLD